MQLVVVIIVIAMSTSSKSLYFDHISYCYVNFGSSAKVILLGPLNSNFSIQVVSWSPTHKTGRVTSTKWTNPPSLRGQPFNTGRCG